MTLAGSCRCGAGGPTPAGPFRTARRGGVLQRIALALVLGLVGCTTYGSPPAHTPVAAPSVPSCSVAIREPDTWPSELQDWYLRKADGLVADLGRTGWFREVGFLADLSGHPDFILEMLPSPNTLNEPYLAALTLGLVPNPMHEWHGYKFRLESPPSVRDREVDTTYLTTGWFGWLVPLIALHPRQHLEEATELHASYFARQLMEHAPELSKPCSH